MKRMICMLMALVLLLSLGGCHRDAQNETQTTQDDVPAETTQATNPQEMLPVDVYVGTPGENGGLAAGKCRVEYAGNRSAVRYISSLEELPDQEELAAYDEAYFRDHALLLVLETVNSGSVQVDIQSIQVSGANGVVTLFHETPDQMGTTDMATWVLWAEVEAGLDCQWSIANPALQDSGVKR